MTIVTDYVMIFVRGKGWKCTPYGEEFQFLRTWQYFPYGGFQILFMSGFQFRLDCEESLIFVLSHSRLRARVRGARRSLRLRSPRVALRKMDDRSLFNFLGQVFIVTRAKSFAERGFSLGLKMCRPQADSKTSRRTREKTYGTQRSPSGLADSRSDKENFDHYIHSLCCA